MAREPELSQEIIVGKSAQEYFRDLVAEALGHRTFRVQEGTEFYLVDLLARFLDLETLYVRQADGTVDAEPLAMVLLRALAAGRERRYQGLKRIGDTSLFVSGFFGDSLARSAVDPGYYIALGESAYEALSGRGAVPRGLGEVYGELAGRFEAFVDLFAEIAELAQLRSNRGLVKLYERFLATGSERVAQLLRERGVALFAGPPRGGLEQ